VNDPFEGQTCFLLPGWKWNREGIAVSRDPGLFFRRNSRFLEKMEG
jgi:hypothetical protein